jgi:hypothetical protein
MNITITFCLRPGQIALFYERGHILMAWDYFVSLLRRPRIARLCIFLIQMTIF